MLPMELQSKSNDMIAEDSKKRKSDYITTRELADVLGVSIRTVNETVDRLLESTFQKSFESIETVSNGGRPSKMFTEKQATIIKQEIQKHHNLQSRQIDNVSTEIEENQIIADAISILDRRNKELMQRVQNAESSLEVFIKSNDLLIIRDVAKVLDFKNIGEKKLYNILRELKILNWENIPYQRFIDNGYFKVVEYHYTDKKGKIHISKTPKVTQKGVVYLNKVVSKFIKDIRGDILTLDDAFYYKDLI